MPLQRDTSSAIYWQDVDLDDPDLDEAISNGLKDRKDNSTDLKDHSRAPDAASQHETDPVHPSAARPSSITHGVNKVDDAERAGADGLMEDYAQDAQMHMQPTEKDDEEEFTFNPDAELQDAQAEHHDYENAQFYEKINFGEFSKYMQNKRRKLGVQQGAFKLNAKNGETSELLQGIRIHINGETEPPAHVLSHLVVLHGGVYVPYLDGKKTSAAYIIASNLTPRKRVIFKEYKVVRAEWLMDSIRDQKIKDWRLYREDQTPVREEDIGVAPAGTQIAQPRLAFQARPTPSAAITAKPTTPVKTTDDKMAISPASVKSPRRPPPPTSDPLKQIQADSLEAAALAEQQEAGPSKVGWYQTTSNARSAALLKDEAWRLQETAVNATEFLDKYYRESRLHWLSTWKAELKKMVGELSEGREVDLAKQRRKGTLKGTEQDGRVVMHIDFDSFFVSASLLARPHLKGQPVVVCHATVGDTASSSEIASASYEAREFGIKNGMSLGSARTKCPQLQTVPYDFDLYRSTSAKFYSILFSHAQELEAVSVDEAYISLPDTTPPRNQKQLLALAEEIRSEIREATGLETSIGVSHNKLLARLATNRAKPASTFQIGNGTGTTGEEIQDFLKDIDIETLPGIGWKRANDIEEKLTELQKRLAGSHFAKRDMKGKGPERIADEPKFEKVGEILGFTKNQLKEVIGEKTGEMLYNYARGIDSRELEMDGVRKSVSAEVNYGIRFKTKSEVDIFLGDQGLAGELARRLRGLGYKGRQLTLKVMRRAESAPIEPPKFLGHGVCDVFNVSKQLDLTNDAVILGKAACELMQSLACPPGELRGIGLQMQKLEHSAGASAAGAQGGGQGRLTFEVVGKSAATSNSTVDLLATHSPIVVSDRTSSPHLIRQTPTVAGRSSRSKTAVNYVDLSSEVSEEEDLSVLSQAPANFIDKPRRAGQQQTILGGDLVKRSKSVSEQPKPIIIPATQPQKAIIIPETSPAVHNAGPVLPSPKKLTDKQLSLLGLDATYFHSCSRPMQNEILRECLLQKGERDEVQRLLKEAGVKTKKGKKEKPLYAPVFEQAAANAAKREERIKREAEKAKRKKRGPVYLHLNMSSAGKVPTFAGKNELQDLRKVLKQWMDGVGMDAAPALEEVGEFTKYCLDTVSSSPTRNGGKGPDIAKIASLLGWWKYLIQERQQKANEVGSQRLAADAWKETYQQVERKVSKAVEREWGAALYIR